MKNINKKTWVLILVGLSINYSCKKFLEIGPPRDSATSSQMFESEEIATSAVVGIYSRMNGYGGYSGGEYSISVLNGLSADELFSYNPSLNAFYDNQIPVTDPTSSAYLWGESYSYIYACNAIIEGLSSNSSVTETTRKQLIGEAKFIRAFCYLYLTNLYGEVPLNLTSDYRQNEFAKKSSQDEIYKQIVQDLQESEALLRADYVNNERVRPIKWAASALLARVYLYRKDWNLAIAKANEVIENKQLYNLSEDLNKVFLKNSSEAIWQLMPAPGNNTNEGNLFILNSAPYRVALSSELVKSFSDTDLRKQAWINKFSDVTGEYFYAQKYKQQYSSIFDEYSMVIRLAEMYLIRAEALAQTERPDLALNDLNVIRKRAGYSIPLTGYNSSQCLDEVELQRRLELFTEWGHRWIDLKRTGRASAVLSPIKGTTWSDTDILYPIPADEINRNRNITQNNGY